MRSLEPNRSAICTSLPLLIATVAGCWERIEYTGTPPASPPTLGAKSASLVPNSERATSLPVAPPLPPAATESTPPKREVDRYAAPANAGGSAESVPVTAPPVTAPAASTVAESASPTPENDRNATSPPTSSATPIATPPVASAGSSAPIASAAPTAPHTGATPASATTAAAPATNTLNSRRAAWLLGSRLSLAALAHDRGVAEKNVPIWFDDARTLAKFLGTIIADLPEPAATGDDGPASRQVVNYLLLNGQRIGQELSKLHGPEQAALFEIALKSNILLLLYSPGASAGTSIATAISQAAPQAKLPAELWQPLVGALGKQAPQSDVQAAVRKMHIDVDQFLAGTAEQSGR